MKITNKKEASEYLDIPENEIFDFRIFSNGDWAYEDKDEYCHLFRKINNEWTELTKDVKAFSIDSHNNGDWDYTDEDYNWYKFNKKNKLVKGYNNLY